MKKIFIDGAEGTTGLEIKKRLNTLNGYDVYQLAGAERKNAEIRKSCLNSCDIAILCLPDDAAKESVAMTENENVKIIDASTAHRTAAGWAYGFPELCAEFSAAIKNGKRVAVPGCHASGFLALVYPLVKTGILSADYPFSAVSLTGYSGGGRAKISEYENITPLSELHAPRFYALEQEHKHLKEMQYVAGLSQKPIFSPVICSYYSGIALNIPIHTYNLNNIGGAADLSDFYAEYYKNTVITVKNAEKFICADAIHGTDGMEITVSGNSERLTLTAVYDNLGKGASGAAIQCLKLMTE